MENFTLDQRNVPLRAGETLLWRGRPDPSKHFAKADVFLVPFSVVWGGVFLASALTGIVTSAGRANANPMSIAFSLLFSAVVVYVVFGRFIVKAVLKKKTEYILTNSRAIVLRSGRITRDTMLRSAPISTELSRNGQHGTVYFGQTGGRNWQLTNTGMDVFSGGSSVAFFDVKNPQELFQSLPMD